QRGEHRLHRQPLQPFRVLPVAESGDHPALAERGRQANVEEGRLPDSARSVEYRQRTRENVIGDNLAVLSPTEEVGGVRLLERVEADIRAVPRVGERAHALRSSSAASLSANSTRSIG